MPELLSLSRAARLAGVSRGEIQKEIRKGNLMTFEGEVKLSNLQKVYPHISVENSTMIERLERIQERASQKIQNLKPPSRGKLMDEIERLQLALEDAQVEIDKYHELVMALSKRVDHIRQQSDCPHEQKMVLQALTTWIYTQMKQRA